MQFEASEIITAKFETFRQGLISCRGQNYENKTVKFNLVAQKVTKDWEKNPEIVEYKETFMFYALRQNINNGSTFQDNHNWMTIFFYSKMARIFLKAGKLEIQVLHCACWSQSQPKL